MNTPATTAAEALAHIRAGGTAYVATYGHLDVITPRSLAKWESAGFERLRDRAGRIEMAVGRSFARLTPGSLMLRHA